MLEIRRFNIDPNVKSVVISAENVMVQFKRVSNSCVDCKLLGRQDRNWQTQR